MEDQLLRQQEKGQLGVGDDDTEELVFKVLVVGEPGVGKTSLIRRYVDGIFTKRYKSTIGVDFSYKTLFRNVIELEDGKEVSKTYKITLQFWDLAGQERINSQVRVYYRQTDGVLCVSDVTREETKNQVIRWREAVMENSTDKRGIQNSPPCVLLFNKMDLFGTTQVWNFGELVPIINNNNGAKNQNFIETDPDLISVEITLDEDQTTVIEKPNINNGNSMMVMPNIISITKDKKEGGIEQPEDKRYELNDSIKPYMDFACSNDFIAGVPTSASDGIGINYAITLLLKRMLDRRAIERGSDAADDRITLVDVIKDQTTSYCGYC